MPNTRVYCDETGELIPIVINKETGETQLENNIPSQSHIHGSSQNVDPFSKLNVHNNKEFDELKESIKSGYNTTSPRLLLIPTTMFFSPFLTILLALLELYLHIRCHSRNKRLKESDVYYRSPMHMITSQFCASCREAAASDRVGQLQDQRRYRYDYFRGIAG